MELNIRYVYMCNNVEAAPKMSVKVIVKILKKEKGSNVVMSYTSFAYHSAFCHVVAYSVAFI